MIRRRPSSHRGNAPRRPRHRPAPRRLVSNRERLFWILGLVALAVVIFYLLRSLFAILLASVIFAYLLDPVVDRLEARGMSREFGIGVVFGGLLLGTTLALLLLVPMVAKEFAELSGNLTTYVNDLGERLTEARVWIEAQTGTTLPVTGEELLHELFQGVEEGAVEGSGEASGLSDVLTQAAPNVGRWLGEALAGVLSGGIAVILAVLNWLLLPVFTFYLLRDWDILVAGIDDLVPHSHRPTVRRLAKSIDGRLSAFVRGQILVAGGQGVIYAIGLLISGIDLAIAVGLAAGALAVVPYLGTIVGIGLASLLAILKFGLSWHLLAVWGTFAVAQVVEGLYLTPKILGDQVGLHPLVVMLAVIVGGSLFGVGGMLLAIPVTAAALVLIEEWMGRYRDSRFFSEAAGGP